MISSGLFSWCVFVLFFVHGYANRTLENTGIPAGLLSNCPGARKSVKISSNLLKELQVVVHQLKNNGEVYSKRFTYSNAARMIAADRMIDLRRRRTVMYVVGFMDSAAFPQSRAIATAYARRGYNVLLLETVRFTTYIYPKAVRISREVGRRAGMFLVELHSMGVQSSNLELVGTSLGAHVSAHAARYYLEKTGEKVARLTGLDPAGPCFRNLPPEDRFSPGAAVHTDAVHTNIDGFGMPSPIGDVDFYVNGGEFQPGDILEIPCLVLCSHLRAIIYWWIAVDNPNKFIAMSCDSVQDARDALCYKSFRFKNTLGLETDFSKPGLYYLSTKNTFPYYYGDEGLKSENEIFTRRLGDINSIDNLEVNN